MRGPGHSRKSRQDAGFGDTPPGEHNGRMPEAAAAQGDPDSFDADEMRELSGYAHLAQRLKEAHEALRDMDLERAERAGLVRRLLVITAASRHDSRDALRRLDRFLDELVLRHKGD